MKFSVLQSKKTETQYGVPIFSLAVMFLAVTLLTSDVFAQRITYESLRMRDRQPKVFVDHLVLPDPATEEKTLVSTFRIEHNFLSFRRYQGDRSRDPMQQFYAEPTVRVSVRSASQQGSESRVSRTTQRRDDRPAGGETVATSNWSETVYAETFEQAQSSGLFVQNMVRTSLAPGRYNIETTMSANGRNRRNLEPGFHITGTDDDGTAYFYFLDSASAPSAPFHTPLMNMGRNVYFGRDHQLAIWLPDLTGDAEYKLEIHQLRIQQRDTTVQDMVFEHAIDRENVLIGYRPEISMENNQPHFSLTESDDDVSYGSFYLLRIPNSTFENAHFRVRLFRTSAESDGDSTILAKRSYQSLWLDMPVSLYNLDVAISMMRYIVDEETLRSLRRGSRQEREQRFREFWNRRDPSPDKEYNELMVEYFRRIDNAYERFTTPNNPGYESDQGKIYITNGEPNRRERTFPPNQPARETWHYDSRTFVFEATTGFGDYRLVERR